MESCYLNNLIVWNLQYNKYDDHMIKKLIPNTTKIIYNSKV